MHRKGNHVDAMFVASQNDDLAEEHVEGGCVSLDKSLAMHMTCMYLMYNKGTGGYRTEQVKMK